MIISEFLPLKNKIKSMKDLLFSLYSLYYFILNIYDMQSQQCYIYFIKNDCLNIMVIQFISVFYIRERIPIW